MRISLILALTISLMTTGHAEEVTSLSEIKKYVVEICDKVDVNGKITRKEIEGNFDANAGTVIRLIGGKIGGEVSISKENIDHNNLSLEDIPAQMIDARQCKKELTLFLVNERKEIRRTMEKKLSAENEWIYRTGKNWDSLLMSAFAGSNDLPIIMQNGIDLTKKDGLYMLSIEKRYKEAVFPAYINFMTKEVCVPYPYPRFAFILNTNRSSKETFFMQGACIVKLEDI